MPLLSVIVPVFNTEKYLAKCLDSIINQTLKDIEIIIVNDCTQDNSEIIILDYLKRDNRISYIKHEKNLGLGGARNTGIQSASGEYIAFLDSDDYIEKNCYENILSLMKEYNADLGIFSAINFYDNTGKKYYDTFFDVDIVNASKITSENISKIACTSWNKVFKLKDIVDNKILFPEHLKHEDEEFWYKYAALVKPTAVGDKSTYYNYRQRDNSIIAMGNVSRKDLVNVFDNVYQFWKINGLDEEYKSTLIPKISWSYHWYNELKDEYKDYFLSNMKKLLQKMDISDDDWNSMDNKAKELYFSNPKFSIVIPVYNTEKYLSRCLDSIINQSYENLDIIIIDDCSNYNCKEIVESYMKKDTRIRYKRFEKNKGTLLVRKEGSLLAEGNYTTYIDSDDEFYIDTFKTIASILKYNRTDIVQFKAKIISNNKEKNNELYKWVSTYNFYSNKDIFLDVMHHKIPHNIWGKFYKTSILKKSAHYIPDIYLINAEDLLQTFIALYFSKNYQFVDKELYIYHYELGISSSIAEMSREKYDMLCNTTTTSLKECYNFLNKIYDGDLYKLSFANLITLNYDYMYDIRNRAKPEDREYFDNILKKYFGLNIRNNYNTYEKIMEYYSNFNDGAFSYDSIDKDNCINEDLLPYFFYIIRDSKYLTIHLFGIKITIKNKKEYYKYKVITISTILRRIFSVYKKNNVLKINLLFFKIGIKIKK